MYSSENSSCLRLRQPNRTISPGITFVIIYRFFHNSVMQEAFPEQICSGRALLFRRFTLISPAGTEFAYRMARESDMFHHSRSNL